MFPARDHRTLSYGRRGPKSPKRTATVHPETRVNSTTHSVYGPYGEDMAKVFSVASMTPQRTTLPPLETMTPVPSDRIVTQPMRARALPQVGHPDQTPPPPGQTRGYTPTPPPKQPRGQLERERQEAERERLEEEEERRKQELDKANRQQMEQSARKDDVADASPSSELVQRNTKTNGVAERSKPLEPLDHHARALVSRSNLNQALPKPQSTDSQVADAPPGEASTVSWFPAFVATHPFQVAIVMFIIFTILSSIGIFAVPFKGTTNGNFYPRNDPIAEKWDSYDSRLSTVESLPTQGVRTQGEYVLGLYYHAPDNSNLITPERLSKIRDLERQLLEDPDYSSFCLLVDGRCSQYPDRLSIADFYFPIGRFPGAVTPSRRLRALQAGSANVTANVTGPASTATSSNSTANNGTTGSPVATPVPSPGDQGQVSTAATSGGDSPPIIDSTEYDGVTLRDIAQTTLDIQTMLTYNPSAGVRFIFDNKFNTSGEATVVRSLYKFGGPYAGYKNVNDRPDQQKERFESFISKYDSIFRNAGDSDVDVYWFGDILTEKELNRLVTQDLLFVSGSIVLVVILVWLQTWSFFLTLMGLGHILASLPTAYFFYRIVARIEYTPALVFMSGYILLGIGADDIFVFTDAWKQSRVELSVEAPLEVRMSWVWHRAAKAMMVTSLTTFVAFVATAFSPLPTIRAFGIFSAICVLVNYVFVITWYAAIVVIWHRYLEYSCCGACTATWADTKPDGLLVNHTLTNTKATSSPGSDHVPQGPTHRKKESLNQPNSPPQDGSAHRELRGNTEHQQPVSRSRGPTSSPVNYPAQGSDADTSAEYTPRSRPPRPMLHERSESGQFSERTVQALKAANIDEDDFEDDGGSDVEEDFTSDNEGFNVHHENPSIAGEDENDGGDDDGHTSQQSHHSVHSTGSVVRHDTPVPSGDSAGRDGHPPVLSGEQPTSNNTVSHGASQFVSATNKPLEAGLLALGSSRRAASDSSNADLISKSHNQVPPSGDSPLTQGDSMPESNSKSTAPTGQQTVQSVSLEGGTNSHLGSHDYRRIEQWYRDYVSPFVLASKWGWIFVFVCACAVGGWSASMLEPPLQPSVQLPDSHPLVKVLEFERDSFDATKDDVLERNVYFVYGISSIDRTGVDMNNPDLKGRPVFDTNFDASSIDAQTLLWNTCQAAYQSDLVFEEKHVCFIEGFRKWRTSNGQNPVVQDPEEFGPQFQQFRNSNDSSDYLDYFAMRDDGNLLWGVFEFRTSLPVRPSTSETEAAYDQWQALSQTWNDNAPEDLSPMIRQYQTSETWVFMRTRQVLVSVSLIGLGIALGAALITLLLSTGNAIIALLAFLSMCGVVVSVLGMIVAYGWDLELAEAIAIIILAGLSIDYSVHMAIAYQNSAATSPTARVTDALTEMGVSISGGAATTIAATVLLFLAQFPIFFRFGGFIVTTIVLSFIFSIFVLTSFLCVLGPVGDTGNIFFCCDRNDSVSDTTSPAQSSRDQDRPAHARDQVSFAAARGEPSDEGSALTQTSNQIRRDGPSEELLPTSGDRRLAETRKG